MFEGKRYIHALFAAVIAASLVGPATGAELDRFKDMSGSLKIAGSTTTLPVMEEAVKRITAANPGIKIELSGGGSGMGARMVGMGQVDIGNTSRPLTESEKPGLKSTVFARDAVVLVVHLENPVSSLKSDQIKEIYSGKLLNWKDLGGPDKPIHVYTRTKGSGTRKFFEDKVLEKSPVTKDAKHVPSNKTMRVAVSRDPLAIGFVSASYVDSSVKPVTVDGTAPSHENIVNGSYTLMRGLFMNTKGEPTGLAKAFVEYVTSEEGVGIVKSKGYFPAK